MEKYYYKDGSRVRIGNVVNEINGVKNVTVTVSLIESNPDLFFKAEYLFTTKDNIDIYEGDMSYLVNKELKIFGPKQYRGFGENLIFFYTREAAEKYVEKHKTKSLEDYEKKLLYKEGLFDLPIKGYALEKDIFYCHLKQHEPYLYYKKVLQIIANDLNKGWVPNWNNIDEYKFHIRLSNKALERKYTTNFNIFMQMDTIYFKSEEIANKAVEIMGDKLDIIFK